MGSKASATHFDAQLQHEKEFCELLCTLLPDSTVLWKRAQVGFLDKGAIYPSYTGTRSAKMEVSQCPTSKVRVEEGRWQVPTTFPANVSMEGGNLGFMLGP